MKIFTENSLKKLSDEEYFDLAKNGKLDFSEKAKYLDSAGSEIDFEQINIDDYIGEFYLNKETGKIEEVYLEKNIEKAKEFQKKFDEALEEKYIFKLLDFKNEEISGILEKAFKKDQDMRMDGKEIDLVVDFENLKIAVSILENNKNYLEETGTEQDFRNIFYLIQHGPLKFQENYIYFFINISEKGKLEKSELPKMIDRILISKGELQKYGTQYFRNKESGKFELYEIEDLKNIDKIRKIMDLGTLEEQNKKMGV